MKTLSKVLVVDDDPVVGKSFDRVLSNRGYAVVTASDGAEALRKIAAEEYDAVFTDIRMPGMDGIAVAEHIKQQQPWLPVVIVSGYATTENEARAKAAGVSAVLHKPLSPEMIEDSARDAMLVRDAGAAPRVSAAAPVAQPEPSPDVAPGPGCRETVRTHGRCTVPESRLYRAAAIRRSGHADRVSVLVRRPGAGQATRVE